MRTGLAYLRDVVHSADGLARVVQAVDATLHTVHRTQTRDMVSLEWKHESSGAAWMVCMLCCKADPPPVACKALHTAIVGVVDEVVATPRPGGVGATGAWYAGCCLLLQAPLPVLTTPTTWLALP